MALKSTNTLVGTQEVFCLTANEMAEYIKCARDPIYFIKTYVKIKPVDGGELQPFNLWEFQEKMLEQYNDNRFNIILCPRQSGKTQCTVAYILWYVLFNENVTAACLANKEKMAKEILARLQISYENLPRFLKQGVSSWNKSSVTFGNGSSIIAGSTSISSIRGFSISLLYCDEFAHVDKHKAEEFYKSVYPSIAAGKNTKIIVSSTPNGLNLFYSMWIKAQKKESEFIPLSINWWDVPGRDEEWKKKTIANTSEEQFRQEFATEFIGSSHTLLSPATIQELEYQIRTPIKSSKDGLDIHEWPANNHIYAITVDVSRGLGLDSSAFSVIDLSEIPYRQVAKYRNNQIDALLYPTQVYNAARLYNDAYVLVEISDIGEQVANILHHELEYENLIKVQRKGQQGQQISPGHVKKIQFGVKTSHQTKKAGCANLKTLIEMKKLLVWDRETIDELKTFIQVKDTYQAEEGYHDDLCSSLWLFGWFIAQKHIRESLSRSLRAVIQHEHLNIVEEDLIPFFSDQDFDPEKVEEDIEIQVTNWEGYMEDRRHIRPFDPFYGHEIIDYISIDMPRK